MNLDLTRKLAVLQATATNLRGASTAFRDTADMLAHREFQNELAEYLAVHRASEDIPDDPAGFVSQEVERLESVLQSIGEFVKAQLELGSPLLDPKTNSLTRPQIVEGKEAADEAFTALVENQHRLAEGFLNKDLVMDNGAIDLAPELPAFARIARPTSALLQPERPALCAFVNGEGELHAQVVTHLESVREAGVYLLEVHAQQAEALRQALALAEAGDFARAAALVENLSPAFADLPYHNITEAIESWRKGLREVEEKFTRLKTEIEARWHAPFAQPWQVAPRQTVLEEKVQQFQDYLVKFHGGLEVRKASDYAREGHSLFKKLTQQCAVLHSGIPLSLQAARTRALAELALVVALAVLCAQFHRQLLPVLGPVLGLLLLVQGAKWLGRWLQARTRVDFQIEAGGHAVEDLEKACAFFNGRLLRPGDHLAPGTYQLTLDPSLYEPFSKTVQIRFGLRNRLGAIRAQLNRDAYSNSLGMRFVPVPGTTVLFGVWPVRVQDYEAFAREQTHKWPRAKFKQEPTHPAVNTSWDDARFFCLWLTERERKEGRLGERDNYRLPTDLEWSAAVDLPKETGATPAERDGKIRDVYPWGTQWPPPKGVGNYDAELRPSGFDYTSPVGTFPANRLGLYDLGGNVWEWCQDAYDIQHNCRVLRGASWHSAKPHTLLSSTRLFNSPGHRVDIAGFRVVLEARRPSPVFAAREKEAPAGLEPNGRNGFHPNGSETNQSHPA